MDFSAWLFMMIGFVAFLAFVIRVLSSYENTDAPLAEDSTDRFPNNPALHQFLSHRDISENAENDFTKIVEYQVEVLSNGQFHLSHGNGAVSFDTRRFQKYGDHKNNQYKIIRSVDFRNQPLLGVAFTESHVVIYPFFDTVDFYGELGLIVCSRAAPFVYSNYIDKYYFDLKGRFLHKEIAEGEGRHLPSFGLDAETGEHVPIKPISHPYRTDRFVSPYMAIISRDHAQFGLMDNEGRLLLDTIYDHIWMEPDGKSALLKTKDTSYYFDTKTLNRKQLAGEVWAPLINGSTQIRTKDKPTKYGLVDAHGKELIAPIYDGIEYCLNPSLFRVCTGGMVWQIDEEALDVFEKYLQTEQHGNWEQELDGVLPHTKWGVLNTAGKTVVPIEFAWVESASEKVLLVNRGGYLYRYSEILDTDDRWLSSSTTVLVGGLWGAYDNDGNLIEPINYKTPNPLLARYRDPKKKYDPFYDDDDDEEEVYIHYIDWSEESSKSDFW